MMKRAASILCLCLQFCMVTEVFSADVLRIREDSPNRYEVVEGDTLWDISEMFLEDPWRWPEIWQRNPQIENPDLIYPGDIIELIYENGVPRLALRRGGAPGGRPVIRLSPQVRKIPRASAIPVIELEEISAFLRQNRVVSREELKTAPSILETRNGNLIASEGDQVFARGNWSDGLSSYDVLRMGKVYRDPGHGDQLGIEAIYVARVSLLNITAEDVATLVIDDARMDVRAGDILIGSDSVAINPSYFPKPPEREISANILEVGNGLEIGGLYDTLLVSAGKDDGLKVGDLLALKKPDRKVRDKNAKSLLKPMGEKVTLPGEKYASILVYKTFDKTSFGLVLSIEKDAIRLEDEVVNP